MKILKLYKTAGISDLKAEKIKQFGPRTRKWLLQIINICKELNIPKVWRKPSV